MKQNKKLFLILIVFVILPLVAVYIIGLLSEIGKFNFSTETGKVILNIGIWISILSSFVIIVLNARSQTPKSFWYTIPTTFIVVLLILFYFGYSLSHFGF